MGLWNKAVLLPKSLCGPEVDLIYEGGEVAHRFEADPSFRSSNNVLDDARNIPEETNPASAFMILDSIRGSIRDTLD